MPDTWAVLINSPAQMETLGATKWLHDPSPNPRTRNPFPFPFPFPLSIAARKGIVIIRIVTRRLPNDY